MSCCYASIVHHFVVSARAAQRRGNSRTHHDLPTRYLVGAASRNLKAPKEAVLVRASPAQTLLRRRPSTGEIRVEHTIHRYRTVFCFVFSRAAFITTQNHGDEYECVADITIHTPLFKARLVHKLWSSSIRAETFDDIVISSVA